MAVVSSISSKLLSDAQSLVNNIKREFSAEYSIEVYVISASGTPSEVYSGPSHNLSISFFREVLVTSGTLYAFSVAGVPRQDADLADLYPGKILRREFGWITAPAPPVLEERQSTSLKLSWPKLKSCGLNFELNGKVTYTIHGAEGDEHHRGVPAKCVDASSLEFKKVFSSDSAVCAIIEDLKSSYWYHWRVVYEYAGAHFVSESLAIPTAGGVPLAPLPPVIWTMKAPGPMLEKRSGVELKVKMKWPEASYVGPSIEKYMLQLHEVFVDLTEDQLEPFAPDFGSPKSKILAAISRSQQRRSPGSRGGHKVADESELTKSQALNKIKQQMQEDKVQSSRWTTIYCDGAPELILRAPKVGTLQWNFRLRARNCNGWSNDWCYFFINHASHPEIFPAGEVMERSWYVSTPVAPRSSAPRLMTQPGRQRQASRAQSRITENAFDSDGFILGQSVGLSSEHESSKTSGRRKQPSTAPPITLQKSRAQVSGVNEEDSLWVDDFASRDAGPSVQAYSIESVCDEDRIQDIADKELKRVKENFPFGINDDFADTTMRAPFISSYDADDDGYGKN